MKTKIILFFIASISWMLISCQNDRLEENLLDTKNSIENLDGLKEKFSYALAKVFNESKGVRELIKKEALKQFDYDYDVLYLLVKEQEIKGEENLEKQILRYMDKKELSLLIQKIPTLTIFVPTLPDNVFSAENWDILADIPCVAYKDDKGKILFVDSIGNIDDTFRDDEIPLFPVVVVKPSERIVLQSALTRSVNSSDILRTGNGINLAFEYPEYNNQLAQTRIGDNKDIPESLNKVFEAKKYADSNGIWQRDYIYYDIKNKDGNGVLCRNMSECLYSFELTGDAVNMYNIISDQRDDPHYIYGESLVSGRKPDGTLSWPTGWYEGNYEFIIKIYISNDQLVSNEIVKALSVSPRKLFILKKKDNDRSRRVIGIESSIKYYLPEPLPLFDWDIEHYSTSVKISIAEKDENVTEQTVVQTTTSFASNFGFDINFGEVVKKGAKFGVSGSKERKVSTTITRTLGSDELGDVIINFGDDVVVKDELVDRFLGEPVKPTRLPRTDYVPPFNPKYNSGYYKIEVVPLAMY